MKVKILFSYTESIIPKGCRKARDVSFDDGEVTINIKDIGAADAPVAIRATGKLDDKTPFTTQYRWWKDKLWTSLRVSCGVPDSHTCHEADWDYAPLPADGVIDLRNGGRLNNPGIGLSAYHLTWKRAEGELKEQLDNIVLIDGVIHKVASEPCYKVMTFGMGCNHGGTALMLDNRSKHFGKSYGLLDREAGIEAATNAATERGDDNSLPIVPHGPQFEVLIPETIKLRIKQPAPRAVKPKVVLGISTAGRGCYF